MLPVSGAISRERKLRKKSLFWTPYANITSFTFTVTSGSVERITINYAPVPPTGLQADLEGAITRLTWNINPEPDVTGYKIYSRNTDEPYLAEIGTSTTNSFDTGHPYDGARIYAISAIRADSTESFLSDMVQNDDRDHDGLTDEQEMALGTTINNPDTDEDGLKDGEEYTYRTNPLKADTDGDGYSDYEEVQAGSDPLDSDSIPTFHLSVAVQGAGKVTSDPPGINCPTDCEQDYVREAAVTLTATPEAGSVFAGWSGEGCSGTNATCTVTLHADRSVTSTFNDQPTALLSLNQTSFHPADPLRLQAHLLTPTETPPAGAYLFEAKLWLKTPLSPPADLLSLLDISGPGQVVSLSPGTDQTVDLLNLTVPTDIPTGSYEFGLRLRHPTTGEELNVSLAPFEVLPVGAPSKMKRPQPKALQRLAAVARRGLKLPRVFSAQMPRPSDKTPLNQGFGAVRKGRAGGSLGPWVDRKIGAALVTQPTAHLSLNGASFRVGDPLQLDAQLLTPTEVPPAGSYAFEIKLWLETPMAFPSDLVSIVNLAGPGGVINLAPGFDQTFRVIDTAVPGGISPGAYEFGVRLSHPVTGEELSLEMEPFNVTE